MSLPLRTSAPQRPVPPGALRTGRPSLACLLGLAVGASCTVTEPPLTPPTAPELGTHAPDVDASFELLGGFRLPSDYASEGLALVTDAEGYVVEAIAGAHVHAQSVHVYDLRPAFGSGAATDQYPRATVLRTWTVAELFPRWIEGQSLRDVAVRRSAHGYELAGIGRVFYNTSPRSATQINIRELTTNGTVLGATREIHVPMPEQEFSGFIEDVAHASDFSAIGAGGYDSGQGSLAGPSYAVRDSAGVWRRLLTPPPFGDLTSPRLPRDAEYSCPGGLSWVCIPPTGGMGVWSTERLAGGGVRIGAVTMFIATLGYGEREYSRQSYTFGDPSLDRATAYFFRYDADGTVRFLGYDRWSAAGVGRPVIGLALGRLRGVEGEMLFTVTARAWGEDANRTAPVLQLFRIH